MSQDAVRNVFNKLKEKNISKEGAIAELKVLLSDPNFKELSLHNVSNIGAEGIDVLATILPDTHLTHLNLNIS